MKTLKRPLVAVALAIGLGLVSVLLLSRVVDIPFVSSPFVKRQTPYEIVLYQGKTLDSLEPSDPKGAPILTKDSVTDMKARFVADPFWIERAGTTYVFFEGFNEATRQGDLAVAASDDEGWKYLGVAVDEPFHLSYPQVFEYEGQYYMIPESGETSQLRLYRATEFPLKWTFVRNLLPGRFYDPTIVRRDGRWWLFAATNLESGRMDLFYADTLEGPWHPHPANPIIANDKNLSRPGGRIIVDGEKVYRIAQDDDPEYGMSVSAIEITEMTPERYAERPAFSGPLLGNRFGLFARTYIHQLDTKRVPDGSWVAVGDSLDKFSCGASAWLTASMNAFGLLHPGCSNEAH